MYIYPDREKEREGEREKRVSSSAYTSFEGPDIVDLVTFIIRVLSVTQYSLEAAAVLQFIY